MTERFVVLVMGGRKYAERERVHLSLDALHAKRPITLLIEGGCPTGVDKFAREWAKANGVPNLSYIARWDLHGKAAGPRRNSEMVRKGAPDMALAFAGTEGTYDCVTRCRKAGVPVVDVDRWWDEDADRKADEFESSSVSPLPGSDR